MARIPLKSMAASVAIWIVFGAFSSCQVFKSQEKVADSESHTDKTEILKNPSCRVVHRSKAAMGTLFDLTLCVSEEADEIERIAEDAFAEIQRVEGIMTSYRPDSYVSRINSGAGKRAIPVPDELYNLIEQSKSISLKTEGKLDISFAAMDSLWDFRKPNPTLPKKKDVAKITKLINYNNILTDSKRKTVRLAKAGMRIGLGAIAKGYAVDRAGEILKSRGISNFIVYGGGDLLVEGSKGGLPWKVGIQHPRDKMRYFAKLPLQGREAVVTTGDYEKFFMLNGRRYHHVLDPDTGFPAVGTTSVTIVAKSATFADAMATGVFVLGPEKGMALIESEPDLEGVIVDSDFKTRVSSGIGDRVDFVGVLKKEQGTP